MHRLQQRAAPDAAAAGSSGSVILIKSMIGSVMFIPRRHMISFHPVCLMGNAVLNSQSAMLFRPSGTPAQKLPQKRGEKEIEVIGNFIHCFQ